MTKPQPKTKPDDDALTSEEISRTSAGAPLAQATDDEMAWISPRVAHHPIIEPISCDHPAQRLLFVGSRLLVKAWKNGLAC